MARAACEIAGSVPTHGHRGLSRSHASAPSRPRGAHTLTHTKRNRAWKRCRPQRMNRALATGSICKKKFKLRLNLANRCFSSPFDTTAWQPKHQQHCSSRIVGALPNAIPTTVRIRSVQTLACTNAATRQTTEFSANATLNSQRRSISGVCPSTVTQGHRACLTRTIHLRDWTRMYSRRTTI